MTVPTTLNEHHAKKRIRSAKRTMDRLRKRLKLESHDPVPNTPNAPRDFLFPDGARVFRGRRLTWQVFDPPNENGNANSAIYTEEKTVKNKFTGEKRKVEPSIAWIVNGEHISYETPLSRLLSSGDLGGEV